MAKTFTYLDEFVFPKLRRAEIKVAYETTGHSDETYQSMAKTTPEKLNVEELLYAASLIKDANEKALIYAACENLYPVDQRASNNLGALLFSQGKIAEAEAKFEKANSIKENSTTIGNLAAVAGSKGDFKKAKELLAKADGSVESNYNNGIIAIVEGNYGAAISNFAENKTFNKALAQLLNKDFEGAKATIDASQDNNSAQGFYLKAIIASRTDKADDAVSALKNAIAKDASFKAKAQKDREFLKLNANQAFLDLLK
jgi:tetratricopeptide (TPR) repeat protein